MLLIRSKYFAGVIIKIVEKPGERHPPSERTVVGKSTVVAGGLPISQCGREAGCRSQNPPFIYRRRETGADSDSQADAAAAICLSVSLPENSQCLRVYESTR